MQQWSVALPSLLPRFNFPRVYSVSVVDCYNQKVAQATEFVVFQCLFSQDQQQERYIMMFSYEARNKKVSGISYDFFQIFKAS